MIEIPAGYKEAWQVHDEQYALSDEAVKTLGVHDADARCSVLSDFVIFALAGWNRERFELEHRLKAGERFSQICVLCGDTNRHGIDPRHAFTDEQWQQAVREGLEAR
jgi:hypothetical protein